jgi:hypothetical protein
MWRSDHGGSLDNHPHQHAFVMAGRENLFLCHMPMLDWEIHMYQLVLQVRIPEKDMEEYRQRYDKANSDNKFFLVNTDSDWMTILELATGQKRAFEAGLWDLAYQEPGKKERPWLNIDPYIGYTCVTVDRVVHFRHFDLNLNRPRSLTYLLFGQGQEAHLQHYQTIEPNFDDVVSLARAPIWLPPAQLEAGVHVNFPDLPDSVGVDNCASPLEPGSSHVVQYCGVESWGDVTPDPFEIEIGRNLWFDTAIGNSDGKDPCGAC